MVSFKVPCSSAILERHPTLGAREGGRALEYPDKTPRELGLMEVLRLPGSNRLLENVSWKNRCKGTGNMPLFISIAAQENDSPHERIRKIDVHGYILPNVPAAPDIYDTSG